MNKFKLTIVIVLLIILVLGVTGVVFGAILGANPIEIFKTILQKTAVQGNFDLFHNAQSLVATASALAA